MYTWPWLINNLGTLLLCPIGIIANLLCLLTLATVKKKPPRPSILVNSRQLPLKFMKRLRKKEKLNKYSAKNDGECLEVFRQSGESIQLQCTGKLNNNNKRSNNNQHLDIPNKEISHKLSHQSMLDERYREKKKLSNCSKRFSSISFGSINDDSKRSSNNKNMNDRKYKFSMLRSISQSKQESSIVNGKQKMLRASGFVEYMKAVAFFDMLSAICEFSLSLIVVHRYYIANRYMYKSRQLRETYKTSLNDPNITIQKIQFLKNFQNSNFTQTEPIEQTHAIFRSFFQTLSMRYEASVLDDIYCSLSTFFRYWCYNLSCWYVVALTIDRFVCVVLSNLVIRNRSKNKVISCFSRIFSRVVTNYGKIRCARKIIVLVAIFAAMLHSYRLIFFRFMCDEKKIRVITNNIEKLFYSDYIRFDQFPLIYQTIGKLSKLSAQNSYVTTLNPTEQLIQNQLNDLPKYLTVNVTHCTCKCKQPRVEVYIGVYLFRLCLYFVLPCATLLFCNTAIMCKLKLYNKNSTQSISCNYRWYCSRLRNLFKKKNNETSISNSDKKMLNSPEKKQMSSVSDKNRQKKNQITKTLLIVSCIFVVLFTPQPVIEIINFQMVRNVNNMCHWSLFGNKRNETSSTYRECFKKKLIVLKEFKEKIKLNLLISEFVDLLNNVHYTINFFLYFLQCPSFKALYIYAMKNYFFKFLNFLDNIFSFIHYYCSYRTCNWCMNPESTPPQSPTSLSSSSPISPVSSFNSLEDVDSIRYICDHKTKEQRI